MNRLKTWIWPTLVLALACVVAYDHFPKHEIDHSPASKKVDGAALGKSYGPVVTSKLSDAWLNAARAVTDGKSIAEAQEILQESWKEGRVAYFKEKIAPEFAKVLPEGTEPKDAEERAAVAKLWADFAKGLKGGR